MPFLGWVAIGILIVIVAAGVVAFILDKEEGELEVDPQDERSYHA